MGATSCNEDKHREDTFKFQQRHHTHGFSFRFAYLSGRSHLRHRNLLVRTVYFIAHLNPLMPLHCSYLSIPTRTLRFPILYAYVLCHSPYALCFHVFLSTPRTIMNSYLMHREIFSPICLSIRFFNASGEDVMIQPCLLDGTLGTTTMSLVAQLVTSHIRITITAHRKPVTVIPRLKHDHRRFPRFVRVYS